MPLTNGESFAGFRILRLLGSGGMGEVYLVEHPRLPRRNALKVLPADVSADPEYRTRFIREADLAATLYHPHIVGVHDRGEVNGQLWISMDFVDGRDAAQLLAQRYPVGMPVDEVVRIVTAVASALDYAHKRGLLHRDVKPANIILTHLDDENDQQRILLADFGIARNVDEISGLTPTNMAVGTVAYAAPEQLMGEEEIDGRADQYALAATAYHLLTGARLFPHSNPAVVISRHLNSPPPAVSDMRPDLAALDRALAIALAKNPQARFLRCTDFARALASARDQVGYSQRRREPPSSHGARFIVSSEGVVLDNASPPKPPPGTADGPWWASDKDPTMRAHDTSPRRRHVDSYRPEPRKLSGFKSTLKNHPDLKYALKMAAAAVVFLIISAFLVSGLPTIVEASRRPPTPSVGAPATTPSLLPSPAPSAAVATPQTTTTTTMSTTTTTTATTTAPTTSTLSATVNQPCSETDHDKLVYDPASAQEIACQEIFWPSYGWSWQKAPPTEGVHVRGAACDGQRAYSSSRTADGYLISCMPPSFTNNEIAGPGSVWSQPYNQ
jgi:serine/threonine protein kinase